MDPQEHEVVDLLNVERVAESLEIPGAIWSLRASTDLNVNLIRFVHGDGVEAHVNGEVDVVGVVLKGQGVIIVDGASSPVSGGQLFFIPKGAQRSIHAGEDELVYMTCHRRREGLMPERRRR